MFPIWWIEVYLSKWAGRCTNSRCLLSNVVMVCVRFHAGKRQPNWNTPCQQVSVLLPSTWCQSCLSGLKSNRDCVQQVAKVSRRRLSRVLHQCSSHTLWSGTSTTPYRAPHAMVRMISVMWFLQAARFSPFWSAIGILLVIPAVLHFSPLGCHGGLLSSLHGLSIL